MAGPDNALMGDDTGFDLPKMELDDQSLVEEKKMAKYSRTSEFKRIQDYFNERIEFYQKYMPDGRAVIEVPVGELAEKWAVANAVIAEFKAVINMYEVANDAVESDAKEKNGK